MNIRCISVFNLLQGNLFGSIVVSADGFRSFERLVLEHVGEAGLAHGILDGAGVHIREEGENRGTVWPLADDGSESVGQLFDGDTLFE